MANIFLSYARSDDEAFVKRLYEHLTANGFFVWFDRQCMPSRSLTFLQEIRDEISATKQLILVVGPGALKSDYVRAEWHHALAEGKVVIPVLRLGKFEDLPPELCQFHCPNASEDPVKPESVFYTEIIRILNEPIPPLAAITGEVPALPPHFQPRPEELTTIAKTVFLDLENPVGLKHHEKFVLLNGMGGVGKTVLAAAFTRSTATRRVFKDGIYWLSANETMPALFLCNALCSLITGSQQNLDETAAPVKLKELLAGKRCLLVLDNIWQLSQVQTLYNCLDVNTRVLVTTRESGLVNATGGQGISTLELSKDAALAQLADWAGCTVEALPETAALLAKECGYLPFALALNGAMLAEGMCWEDLLNELQAAQIDFAEKAFINYAYSTVYKTIKVSMDVLANADTNAAMRFNELTAFNWDEGVPLPAIALLWQHTAGISKAASHKLSNSFQNKSLLRLTNKAGATRVFLHDLVLDYLRFTVKDQSELNHTLLAAYRNASQPDWPSGPADGYFHQNLVCHLCKAEQVEEVHRIFALETKEGLNAWYAANEAIDNITGYLKDIELIKEKETGTENDADAIAREIKWLSHYGLIQASLRSLAGTLPRKFKTALLTKGVWSEGRALAEVEQLKDFEQRFFALVELLPFLKDNWLDKAKKDAMQMAESYKGNDANFFAKLIPFYEGEERKLLSSKAIFFSISISSPGYRAKAFAQLVKVLGAGEQRDLIPAALDFLEKEILTAGVNQGWFDSVRILAPHIKVEQMPRLVELVRKIPNQFAKAAAYADIVPYVDATEREALVREGLNEFSKVEGNAEWIYIALAKHLPGVSLDDLFEEIVQKDTREIAHVISFLPGIVSDAEIDVWRKRIDAAQFYYESSRIEAYTALIPHLPLHERDGFIQMICDAIPNLPYDTWREKAYDAIAEWLNKEQLIKAKSVLLSINDQNDIAYAFLALYDHLDEPARQKVHAYFQSSVNISNYLDLYIHLAQKTSGIQQPLLIEKAYEALKQGAYMTGGTMSGNIREEVLAEFVAIAPPEWKADILNAALDWIFRLMTGAESSAEKFEKIIPFLPADIIERGSVILIEQAVKDSAQRVTQTISGNQVGDNRVIPNTIKILAPFMSPGLLQSVVTATGDMQDDDARIMTRIYLLPYMQPEEKHTMLREAVEWQKTTDLHIDDPAQNFCGVLLSLSDELKGEERKDVLANALAAIRSIGSSWRCSHLIQLAKRHDESERTMIIDETVALAKPWNILEIIELMPSADLLSTMEELIVQDMRHWGWSLTRNLAYYTAHTSKEQQYNVWRKLQAPLLSLNRKEMAQRLAKSAPLLQSLGGNACVEDISQSLFKVIEWWK